MAPVLVRGHVGTSYTVLRVLSILGLIIGFFVCFAEAFWGALVLVLSALTLITTEVARAIRCRQQLWVTDTGTGFEVRDAFGTRTFDDEDLFSLDLDRQNIYREGLLKSVRRRFRVKVEGAAEPIEMVNVVPVGQADPLEDFISRNVGAYQARADEALQAGAVVKGKGWALADRTLTIDGQPAVTISTDELQAIDVFDNKVCVWKRGSDDAVLKVPLRSENCFLLQLLLATRIRAGEGEAAQDGLGRILFERKGSRIIAGVLWLVAGSILLASIGLFVAAVANAQVAGGIGAMILALVGGLCAGLAISTRRSVFRCHERGVYKRGVWSRGSLRYADVDSFVYSATRQYYNGAYIGTALNITLSPPPGASNKRIRFNSTVKNADESLDQLRDHIARVIASRMLQQLADGQRVTWTPNLAILPTGIEYRPSGFVGRKNAVLLPFERVFNFDIQQGTFHLWERGKDKSVMQESVAQPNFFPGFYALSMLYAQGSEAAAQPATEQP